MNTQTSELVEIRLYKKEDLDKSVSEVPITSYMPVFLSGSQNIENIKKRVTLIYLSKDPSIIKLRWNYRGYDEGFWVENDSH